MEGGSFYIVFRTNPFFRKGTVLRRLDDGYEKVIFGDRNAGEGVIGYEGLVIPHRTMADFVIRLQREGIDWGAARQDRRRAMGDY